MFNTASLFPLASFFVHVFLLVYVSAQKRRGDKVHNAFLVFESLLAAWAFSDFLTWNLAVPASAMATFALVESAFWMPTGLAFMVFIYRIVGRPLDRMAGAVALFVAAAFIVSAATGGLIVGFSYEYWGVRQVFSPWFGPYMAAGIVVPYLWSLRLVRGMLQQGEQTELRLPLYIFFAGTLVAIGAGGLNDVVLVPLLGMNFLQIASTASVAIAGSMFLAVRRYNFLTVNAEQVQQVFDRVFNDAVEGIILTAADGGIIRSNRAARTMAGIAPGSGSVNVGQVLPDCDEDAWDGNRCEFTRSGRRISVFKSDIRDRKNPVAAVYTLRDVTADRETEARLYRINRQVTSQNRCNRIRAELWRLAADETLGELELIQRILDALGPETDVSRASFSEEQGDGMVCTVEWCRPGASSTIGVAIPMKILEYFMKDDFTELNEEQILRKVPELLHPVARPMVKKLMSGQNIASFAYVPLGTVGGRRAMLSFDICFDLPEKPAWTEQKRLLIQDAVHLLTLALDRRRTRDELEASYGQLEERVIQRTGELHNANATLEASLAEKEVLLKEIHHRVKNNLQVISSLLSLQSRHLSDPCDRAMFVDSQNRIKSMALIHERLYQTGDLARVRFDTYAERLLIDLYRTYSIDPSAVRRTGKVEGIEMTVDKAIPCSLILNELVSNAFKYAYAGRDSGMLEVTLRRAPDSGNAELTVRDDGPGLPPETSAETSESLGLQLVHTLTEQLEGSLDIQNDNGAVFILRFSLDDG